MGTKLALLQLCRKAFVGGELIALFPHSFCDNNNNIIIKLALESFHYEWCRCGLPTPPLPLAEPMPMPMPTCPHQC